MSAIPFNYVDRLSRKVAELFSAPVIITDDRNMIIASTNPLASTGTNGRITMDQSQQMMIPLEVGGRAAKILVGPPTTGETISPRLVQAALDLLRDEAVLIDKFQHQHAIKDNFIYDLLHRNIQDEESVMHQAQFLNVDLAVPRAVILIDVFDLIRPNVEDSVVRRQVQLVIRSVVTFFQLPSDAICAYVGEGKIVVLKASNTANLSPWVDQPENGERGNTPWANLVALKRAAAALHSRLRNDTGSPITIGIGRFHPGILGLADSYQDAKVALSLGERFHGRDRIHCLDELGVAAFIGVPDEQTKIDLATHLLSPLDHEPELLETLDAFFSRDCSPSATADRLCIHRNTLRYRLDKAKYLTGLDPRRFDDAVLIRISLLMRSLRTDLPNLNASAVS